MIDVFLPEERDFPGLGLCHHRVRHCSGETSMFCFRTLLCRRYLSSNTGNYLPYCLVIEEVSRYLSTLEYISNDTDSDNPGSVYGAVRSRARNGPACTSSADAATSLAQKASHCTPLRIRHHSSHHWIQPVLWCLPRILPLTSSRCPSAVAGLSSSATHGNARICGHTMLRAYLGRGNSCESSDITS